MTFFRRIYDPEIGSGAVDVYAMMFACQFIIFIIIVSSWSAFSSPEVNKHTNISCNYDYRLTNVWHTNMLEYLSMDIICFEKRTVFRERSLRTTMSLEEQIVSEDKYLNTFSRQIEAIVH